MANSDRIPEPIADILLRVIDLIVRHDYRALAQLTNANRMSESEIEERLCEYGYTFIHPPSLDATAPDAVRIKDRDLATYNVRFSLWTEEEGRSDLSVELEVALASRGVEVELSNIIVF